jgi:hypothetical protein
MAAEPNFVQIIQAIAALISCCLASTALIYSMCAYTRSLRVSQYNELDKTYLTLLQMAMQNPYFIKPDEITTKEQREKYDIYAFMVWNFLEAIYDKCMKDKNLKETWLPIIGVEGQLHSTWFKHKENKDKFKSSFMIL